MGNHIYVGVTYLVVHPSYIILPFSGLSCAGHAALDMPRNSEKSNEPLPSSGWKMNGHFEHKKNVGILNVGKLILWYFM
jgi:hypothetical protein